MYHPSMNGTLTEISHRSIPDYALDFKFSNPLQVNVNEVTIWHLIHEVQKKLGRKPLLTSLRLSIRTKSATINPSPQETLFSSSTPSCRTHSQIKHSLRPPSKTVPTISRRHCCKEMTLSGLFLHIDFNACTACKFEIHYQTGSSIAINWTKYNCTGTLILSMNQT